MSAESSEAIAVFITAANAEEAARLADLLVGAHLAACVQLLPEIESVYRWQGRVERQSEVLLIAKTTAVMFEQLESEVRALHSYDTPEIVAVPITMASGPYLEWLTNCVASRNEQVSGTTC
ncbi:MAG TPA: divalent-cation tolerance protein CutA [Pyrinomonadaceae bacterium]|nr:divalent-cation tolerance protein CutA [Pyrinomonadaceae bacterium]